MEDEEIVLIQKQAKHYIKKNKKTNPETCALIDSLVKAIDVLFEGQNGLEERMRDVLLEVKELVDSVKIEKSKD